jgi:uncharacterized SAM-dependent methyltransferase
MEADQFTWNKNLIETFNKISTLDFLNDGFSHKAVFDLQSVNGKVGLYSLGYFNGVELK